MKKIKYLFSSLIGLITGLCGAFAGANQTSKGWRRLVVPAFITTISLIKLWSLWAITIIFMSLPFSMGYGIPDENDEGSSLGRFWYSIFKGNKTLTNVFTRGTVGLIVSISLIIVPILRSNWLSYILCILSIIGVYMTISWRDLGIFEFKGKKLLWSEFWVYFTIGVCSQILLWI